MNYGNEYMQHGRWHCRRIGSGTISSGMIGGFIGRSDIDIGSGRAAPSQSAIGIGISGGLLLLSVCSGF